MMGRFSEGEWSGGFVFVLLDAMRRLHLNQVGFMTCQLDLFGDEGGRRKARDICERRSIPPPPPLPRLCPKLWGHVRWQIYLCFVRSS